MSNYFFESEECFNPSTLSNLDQKVKQEQDEQRIEEELLQFSQDSKKYLKVKDKNHQEAKNIPKNMGVLIKNYLVKNYKDLARQNFTIKKFVNKSNQKKYYTRSDLKVLFSNQEAKEICQEYFSSFEIIQDILKSTKTSDCEVILKYIKKLFIATQDPESLCCLKYSDEDF